VWCFLAAASALAEEPAAEETGLSTTFTDDFELRYWRLDRRLPDPSDVAVFDYVEQVNRFNANARSGNWAVDAQVDEVALFLNRYYLDDELFVENELVAPDTFNPMPGSSYINPEKLRLTWETDDATLVFGDSYGAFGRGGALNINRNVDIDIDTSIQGVKAVLRPGAWDITLIAGQLNRQQVAQDNPNLGITGDVRHAMGGIRAERFGLGPANIGAHAVAYKFATEPGFTTGFEQLGDQTPVAAVGGLTTELTSVAGFDWYLEGDVFGYQDMPNALPDSKNDAPGYAVYLSAATYPGPFVLLVEGKRYLQADRINLITGLEQYEVATAPTLEYERAVNEDTAAELNSNDSTGGRAQLDWSAIPGKLTPYAAMAVYRDADLGVPHDNLSPETITHPMVGVEYVSEGKSAIGNFGFRTDDPDDDVTAAAGSPDPAGWCGAGPRKSRDRQIHGDLTVEVPTGPLSLDVALAVELFCWGAVPFNQKGDYIESETSYTLAYGSDVAVTWFMDYTTNALVLNDSPGNLGDERLFGAAEIQVKPADAFTLKAFYGAYKSGIRCSGGQCRQLPGFNGARLSAVATF
jgi:hypothetical protein